MIRAVWLVRSHQIAADLRYWLTYIGYDKRDHSLAHKIYLGYATLFFAVWGFATLALLASFAGAILAALAGSLGLAQAAAGVLALALLGWMVYAAFKASQASPLTFSEDDAALICATPVSRPAVALFWLLGDWIKTGPVFWGLAVTLAFVLQDAALGSSVAVEHVPRYVLAGLRALAAVVPLQAGGMALAWAWGVLRLDAKAGPRRGWVLGPLGLALLLGALLLRRGLPLAEFFDAPGALIFAPLIFPVGAAFGLDGLGLALLAGLAWVLAGLAGLGWAARRLSLNRAAQESTGRAALEAAAGVGDAQAAAESRLRRRLGPGAPPAGLRVESFPLGLGERRWAALAWKAVVRQARRGTWEGLGPAFVLLSAGVGVALAPDWGSRAWTALAWLVAAGQFLTGPLQDDLRRWSLFRGLPLKPEQALLGGLAFPAVLVTLLGWLALALGVGLAEPLSALLPLNPLPPEAALLVPGLALSAGLAAALDILRGARTGRLLAGSAPAPGTTGVLAGAVAAGLVALVTAYSDYFAGAAATAFTAWILLKWAGHALVGIE